MLVARAAVVAADAVDAQALELRRQHAHSVGDHLRDALRLVDHGRVNLPSLVGEDRFPFDHIAQEQQIGGLDLRRRAPVRDQPQNLLGGQRDTLRHHVEVVVGSHFAALPIAVEDLRHLFPGARLRIEAQRRQRVQLGRRVFERLPRRLGHGLLDARVTCSTPLGLAHAGAKLCVLGLELRQLVRRLSRPFVNVA